MCGSLRQEETEVELRVRVAGLEGERDVAQARAADVEAERDLYRDLAIESLRRTAHLTAICWTQRIALDDRSRKDDNYSQGTEAHRHLEAAIPAREETNKLRFKSSLSPGGSEKPRQKRTYVTTRKARSQTGQRLPPGTRVSMAVVNTPRGLRGLSVDVVTEATAPRDYSRLGATRCRPSHPWECRPTEPPQNNEHQQREQDFERDLHGCPQRRSSLSRCSGSPAKGTAGQMSKSSSTGETQKIGFSGW